LPARERDWASINSKLAIIRSYKTTKAGLQGCRQGAV